MAQKRTKKASPKRTAKKRGPKKRSRRSWTNEQKAEMVAYAGDNGVRAAVDKFGVNEASLYRWRRTHPKQRPAKSTARKSSTKRVENGSALMIADLTKKNVQLRNEVARLRTRETKLESALIEAVLSQNG